VQGLGLSVMVFSGFTLERLKREAQENRGIGELLACTDLLVDGPYVEKLRVTNRRWIGSSNQRVHFLSARYRHLEASPSGWDEGRNTMELRLVGGKLFVNGFPEPGIVQLAKTEGHESSECS
jgi:anaerobic ribonucleoside-triphosphate reductase activating protein